MTISCMIRWSEHTHPGSPRPNKGTSSHCSAGSIVWSPTKWVLQRRGWHAEAKKYEWSPNPEDNSSDSPMPMEIWLHRADVPVKLSWTCVCVCSVIARMMLIPTWWWCCCCSSVLTLEMSPCLRCCMVTQVKDIKITDRLSRRCCCSLSITWVFEW